MYSSLFICGFAIWIIATIVLRVAGHHLLYPGNSFETLILFAVSFPASAWVARGLCGRFRLERDQWPSGAVSILMPTLLLDPFSSVFFPVVFPNMSPDVAGTFGGWMLWCCAGALVGVTIRLRRQS